MNKKDMKRLEDGVLDLLSTKRGSKHYKTYQLMYSMIELFKHRERAFNAVIKELGNNAAHL